MDNSQTSSYLPSKKVVVLASAILTGFIVFGLVTNYQTINQFFTSSDTKKIASQESIESQKRIDEDNDGLSNWQEKLWGTDVNNPDTDGDGTTDGKEVEQNRDPTVPAPNDSLGGDIESQDNGTSSENITSEIGAQVMPRALVLAAARQNGENISTNDLDRISSSISETTNVGEIQLSNSSDIQITNDTTPQASERYFDELNTAVQKVNTNTDSNPIRIIAQAQQEGNIEAIDLSPHILRHANAIEEMKQITVPQQFQEFHLKSLQALERKLYSLRKMNAMADDPIGAVIGIKQYRKAREEDIEAAKILNNSLKQYAQSQ